MCPGSCRAAQHLGWGWCQLEVGTGQDEGLAHTSLPSCGFAALRWTEGSTAIVAAIFQEGTWSRSLLDQLVFCEVNALKWDHGLGTRCPSLAEGDKIVCWTSRLLWLG